MQETKQSEGKKKPVNQRARCKMTEMEQKILEYIYLRAISLPFEEIIEGQLITIKFKASAYLKHYGITDGGRNYANLEKTLIGMVKRKFPVRDGNEFTEIELITIVKKTFN